MVELFEGYLYQALRLLLKLMLPRRIRNICFFLFIKFVGFICSLLFSSVFLCGCPFIPSLFSRSHYRSFCFLSLLFSILSLFYFLSHLRTSFVSSWSLSLFPSLLIEIIRLSWEPSHLSYLFHVFLPFFFFALLQSTFFILSYTLLSSFHSPLLIFFLFTPVLFFIPFSLFPFA